MKHATYVRQKHLVPGTTLTERVKRLVWVGYDVEEIMDITAQSKGTIMRCIRKAGIGGYDEAGNIFIDTRFLADFCKDVPGMCDGITKRYWIQTKDE